jgi:uncharacterized protein (DUF58 family)
VGLTPEALARLTKLHLRTRVVVDGLLSGQHRSAHRGQSVEFAEHKEYSPGDEIRHIDWKAYGRFDRYYVKRYEQETNLRAYLVVDASASMAYGDGGGKIEMASVLAAGLATVLTRQQDLVGLGLWRGDTLHLWPPHGSPGHLQALMERLADVTPAGGTNLAALARELAEKVHRRSLIVVLSDLFDPDPQGLPSLLSLRARGHDLAILHLLDRTELDFPFEDPQLFLSMEDERRLEVSPLELRRGYLAELQRFLADTERLCRERDCDYQQVVSDSSLEAALADLLARRDRRAVLRR